VLVHNGTIIGRGHNRRIQRGSPILHGEMDTLENAGRQPAAVYRQCTLYTTLAPCSMCSGAILLYRIPKVIAAEDVTLKGDVDLLRSRGVDVTVLNDARCVKLMADFAAAHPTVWQEDIGEEVLTDSSAV